MDKILTEVPENIRRDWPKLTIGNPAQPWPLLWWALVDIRPNYTDSQWIINVYDPGYHEGGLPIAFCFNHNERLPVATAGWTWKRPDRYQGILTETRAGGWALHHGQGAECWYVATPDIPSVVVWEMYTATDPKVPRSQHHGTLSFTVRPAVGDRLVPHVGDSLKELGQQLAQLEARLAGLGGAPLIDPVIQQLMDQFGVDHQTAAKMRAVMAN